MTRSNSWIVLPFCAAVVAGAALAQERAPSRMWVVTASEVREQPQSSAPVVARTEIGLSVRIEKRFPESGKAAWYRVRVPASPSGWVPASSLALVPKAPPPQKRMEGVLQEREIVKSGATLTSAGRGVDPRVVRFGAVDPARATTLTRFTTAWWHSAIHFRDVPHDGKTRDRSGRALPRGLFSEHKIADGRVADANAMRASLVPDATPRPSPTQRVREAKSGGLKFSYQGRKKRMTDTRRFLSYVKDARDISKAMNAAVDAIHPRDERAIGQATAVALASGLGPILVEDSELASYVASVGNLVALHGERKDVGDGPRSSSRRFTFLVVEDATPGAFSTPGGHVLITTGLLRRLDSESELAFLLAHEIAHDDQEHGLGALKAVTGGNAGVAEAIRRASGRPKGDPIAALFRDQAVFDALVLPLADALRKKLTVLDRAQEAEADLLALKYMTAAGYDGEGALRALAALPPTEGATHDSLETRRVRLVASEHMTKEGATGALRWSATALSRLERPR